MHTQYQRNTLSWPSTVKTRKPDGELTAQIPTSAHYSAVTGQNQPSESLTAGESPHYIPFDKVCTIITWYWNSCFGLVTELLFLSLSNSLTAKSNIAALCQKLSNKRELEIESDFNIRGQCYLLFIIWCQEIVTMPRKRTLVEAAFPIVNCFLFSSRSL